MLSREEILKAEISNRVRKRTLFIFCVTFVCRIIYIMSSGGTLDGEKELDNNHVSSLTFTLPLSPTESLNVEFVCSVLVVADQLLITRLKEMCEVAITENCRSSAIPLSFFPSLLSPSL